MPSFRKIFIESIHCMTSVHYFIDNRKILYRRIHADFLSLYVLDFGVDFPYII